MKSQLCSSALFVLNNIRAGEGCVWVFNVQKDAGEGGVITIQRKQGQSGRCRENCLRLTQFIFWTESIVDVWVLLRVGMYTLYRSTQGMFLGIFHGTLHSRRKDLMHF